MGKIENLDKRIASAIGNEKADLVIKNVDILNVFTNEIEHGDLAITGGYFVGIGEYSGITEIDATGKTIVPGFIDGHIHLESSIVTPYQFTQAVLPHGTTAVVTDPHEIANVCGTKGIDYILEATKELPLDVYVMIPSCVPATPFDESGYTIDSATVADYIDKERVLGLAEMMNYPGVFMRDRQVLEKIEATAAKNKIIDGHAPGVKAKELNAYTSAGVYSDHECTNAEEAIEKIKRGQWIMIREGTASKNLEALLPLCKEPYYSRCLFATDDKHPGDLAVDGHIDYIIKKAIQNGIKTEIAYKIGSLNAATYFRMPNSGAICPGYHADFVILNDYNNVDICAVYKNGVKVSEVNNGTKWIVDAGNNVSVSDDICDTVHIEEVKASDFAIDAEAKVIGLVPGQILTTDEGSASCVNTETDIAKLAVVERHHNTGHIGLCYVKGYGIKKGAVATSIAHDSHNIICVGTNDEDMACAVNSLKRMKGGMVVVSEGKVISELALPIGGLMCDLPVEEAQAKLDNVKEAAYSLGVADGIDPFMTLSFSSLAVIPTLRLTTLGVVDVTKFELLK